MEDGLQHLLVRRAGDAGMWTKLVEKNIYFFCSRAQKWDVEIISILRNLAKLVTTDGAKVRTRTAAGCPECVAELSRLWG